MYNIINWIVEIYYSVFQGYCLQYFYGSFLEYRRQERSWNGFCVIVSYAVLRLCGNQLIPYDYRDIRTIENLLLNFAILVMLALCFYKATKVITAYLVITFMAVSQISFFIAYSIYELVAGLNNLWVWCLENGYIADVNKLEIIINATVIGLLVLMFGIFSILCYCSFKKIIQSFRDKEYVVQSTELIFILAPSMAGYLICVLLRVIVLTVENGIPELIYNKYPMLTLMIPAI